MPALNFFIKIDVIKKNLTLEPTFIRQSSLRFVSTKQIDNRTRELIEFVLGKLIRISGVTGSLRLF